MTEEEIQYKAQSIIQEWGSNDSAPYVEFVEKLASMELPEPPSNLDDAAEEALKKAYPADAYYYVGRTGRRLFKEGFKVGTEWMAGQGVTKEAVIGMATAEISINVSQEALNDLDVFPGDKVIVQIRKKYV